MNNEMEINYIVRFFSVKLISMTGSFENMSHKTHLPSNIFDFFNWWQKCGHYWKPCAGSLSSIAKYSRLCENARSPPKTWRIYILKLVHMYPKNHSYLNFTLRFRLTQYDTLYNGMIQQAGTESLMMLTNMINKAQCLILIQVITSRWLLRMGFPYHISYFRLFQKNMLSVICVDYDPLIWVQ